MPGDLDGFGLARWVRANMSDAKVIITSGVSREAEDAGDLCADGPMIDKPYDHGHVEDRIKQLLAERDRSR